MMPKMRSSGVRAKPPLSRVFVFFAALALMLLAAMAFVAVVAQDAPTQNSTARYLFKQLPFENMQTLSSVISSDIIRQYTEKIAVVRMPDTPQHLEVQNYIASQFDDTNWTVLKDSFEDTTPIGKKRFTNIIASHNEDADNLLVLSAHYDSKYFTTFEFKAATDSAVPCAILIDLAKRMSPMLSNIRPDWGVVIVFFDGEEAFGEWTATDSLYGSRHLAADWSKSTNGKPSKLSRIHSFMLLDLIGGPQPVFQNAYSNVAPAWERLAAIEARLKKNSFTLSSGTKQFFSKSQRTAHISDDHEPFLQKGVPCIHVIAAPFPSVWHTQRDTIENVDFKSATDVARIVNVFVFELLHLTGKGSECTYCG